MTTLEATITAVAAQCLKRPPEATPETSFELLGLDSLATIELAAALEDALGCDLPEDILVDCTDTRSLAARLATLGVGDTRETNDPFTQMFADAVLPDDVWPTGSTVHADSGLRHARTILLTGATGFLGAALLKELLGASDATIVCLVRPTSQPIAVSEPGRLRTITGDLSRPRLGLSDASYDALAHEVDAVCHAAAAVLGLLLRGAAVSQRAGHPGAPAARLLRRRALSFHLQPLHLLLHQWLPHG
ncbi:MAG TPA: SDR family oxidoreductase [Vicinamibacterales bacterium]|nr:SDR family oxidoreductase [Vicinamibacterales bacterium]